MELGTRLLWAKCACKTPDAGGSGENATHALPGLKNSPCFLELIILTVHSDELCDDNMSNPTIRKRMVGEFICTVEPPVSDHPKSEDEVLAYGRWSLSRIEQVSE